MRDEQPEPRRVQIIIVGCSSGMTSLIRAKLDQDLAEVDACMVELAEAAGIAAEELRCMSRDVSSLTLKERIDFSDLKVFSSTLETPPAPKRSRRAKRGHNRALDRIIT